MSDKTQELRDIFLDVADDETVTEAQQESRGSLASDEEIEARLADTIADMREELAFDTALDDDALVTIVRRYYAGDDDDEIAAELADDVTAEDVGHARIDLHLLDDEVETAPVDLAALDDYLQDGTVEDAAAALDVDESTVEHYKRVNDARDEIQRTNDRYRTAFEDALQDRAITERLTQDAREDGLEEATEGQEVDVDF